MSMSQGSQFDSDDALLNDINMTPLIDVMLVLLIIFIITLPVINKAVKVDLPKGEAQTIAVQDKSVDVSITADGSILWNKEPVDDAQLAQKVAVTAVQEQPPVLRVYADKAVRYERVAQLLSTAQKGGLSKIDFVTDATPSH
ncbi:MULTISPECIES: ExbD/TolR family protein [Pseudomonas]|uniref:Biopolymer transporter ExbD n=1 Tax=Pseudomonas canadensis TaxID=915099 RepID=A0ABZ0ZY83_9PSED|nr:MULTISPECIES: biopolymer transporter ExbD [Pseudomonas]MDF3132768.1 biopolymer transporter ExbD [Pseudomonas extremaustralis]WRI21920.1 biopolymer transporter ExbD [Pseudomonas canadensis]